MKRTGPTNRRLWIMPAALAVGVLVCLQLAFPAGFQTAAEATTLATPRTWVARKLSYKDLLDRPALRSKRKCYEADCGLPEQRVCVFEDLILHNGRLFYVTDNASDAVPPIKIAWLKKFEGDDMFHVAVVNQSQLEFDWQTVQVEEVAQAGLFHQQHYSNFYHMVTEVAPSIHYVLCKYLGDCTYSPTNSTQVLFVQEHRPDQPKYIMLDSVADTFKCLSPHPVWHKDEAQLQNKVVVLRRAVVGVSNYVRVYHNWDEEHKRIFQEPPKAEMVLWRQRLADCFGFNFTQAVAPTDPLRILFINRHYSEGRSILNHAELAHRIERMPELAAFPSVDIRLVYLNGDDSIRDQAAQFWNASLLIWPHGASMALTPFLPRGAQAIELIPWLDDDRSRWAAEWTQAIRDAFSLEMDLYSIQNKERKRVLFNLDGLQDFGEYRDAAPEQKVALLERGECPQGREQLCRDWWNHWKVSLNMDWAQLEPTLKIALAKLAELRQAGGLPASSASAGARADLEVSHDDEGAGALER